MPARRQQRGGPVARAEHPVGHEQHGSPAASPSEARAEREPGRVASSTEGPRVRARQRVAKKRRVGRAVGEDIDSSGEKRLRDDARGGGHEYGRGSGAGGRRAERHEGSRRARERLAADHAPDQHVGEERHHERTKSLEQNVIGGVSRPPPARGDAERQPDGEPSRHRHARPRRPKKPQDGCLHERGDHGCRSAWRSDARVRSRADS